MGKSDKDRAAQVHRDAVKDSFAKRESEAAHDKGVAERLKEIAKDEAGKN